jgi:hypothetical protein
MSHKLEHCELNHTGVCVFCGREQNKKEWIARRKAEGVYDPIYNPKPTKQIAPKG